MELQTGRLNNIERKFIPIRKSKLDKYINTLSFIEKYKITQYYYKGYKYRKFEGNDNKFTKSKKEGDYTIVEEISETEFLNNIGKNSIIIKERKKYKDNLYTVEIDKFIKPKKITIIEVSSDTENLQNYHPEDTFIEVTKNPIYRNEYIKNGSIKKDNIIIEGTDGVGKTTTIVKLLEDGIVCQDRCEKVISKNMLFNIEMEERAKVIYEKYFSNKQDTIIIFLVNLDKKELERRINSREKISEFDSEAYKYGILYKETYEFMIKKYETKGRLLMVNCTGLNIEQQYKKVKDLILNLNSKEELK